LIKKFWIFNPPKLIDMGPIGIFEALILIGIFLIPILAITIGRKKRIGAKWSLFFLFSTGFLPGLIFIILSPSKNNLPPPNEKDKIPNTIFGILWLCAAAWMFWKLFNISGEIVDTNTSYIMMLAIGGLLNLIGASYFFNRYNRHKRMYEEQELRRWKNIEQPTEKLPDGNPPATDQLDIPIYDQV
jgi:hypothetical protein